MSFPIQNHSIGGGNFTDFIFSKIKRFALGKPCVVRRYSVNHFAGSIAQRTVRRVNILGGGDFINCARKPLHGIEGLIYALAFRNRGKDLAGLADFDNAFLCRVLLDNFNDGDTALVARSVLNHIKIHRLAVQNVPVG